MDEERQSEEIQSLQSEIEQPNEMLSDEEMLEDASSGRVNIHTTSDSPNFDTDADDPDAMLSDSDTEDVVTCYGKLLHLTDAIGECQDLLSTAGNLHAPNQKYLLGNLVDVVQRVKEQSSSLLEMAVSELEKIDAESDEG